MELNTEELKSMVKSRVRAYFITLDFLLQKLRDKGVFQKHAFNPIAGKIDPFDPDNFNCQPRIFKKEKIMEFSAKAIMRQKSVSPISGSKGSAIAVMNAITKEIFKSIDHSYFESDVNYAKFSMFSFFRLNLDPEDSAKLSDEQKEAIMKLVSETSTSPFMSQEQFSEDLEKTSFEEILSNPDYCSSQLLFCFMDLRSSIIGGFVYSIKNGNIQLVGDKESFYKSLTFSYGEGYVTDKYLVADILPINESSIHLLDL